MRRAAGQALKGAPCYGQLRHYPTPDGYLHKSQVPTMHFQKSLPRMPIPELQKTLDRYLQTQRPICTDEEYTEVEKAVAELRAGRGPALHASLVSRDSKRPETSYINQWWFEMYVNDRRPLPITTNPFLAFRDEANAEKMDQARRAADFIVASVYFKRTLDASLLKPEVFHLKPKPGWFDTVMRLIPGGAPLPFTGNSIHTVIGFLTGAFPLDMSQFANLFCSTRVPRKPEDVVVKNDRGGKQHVAVQRGNRFYKVIVSDEAGKPLPGSSIRAALQNILDAPEDDSPPIGILTTLPRDEWADLRAKIEATPQGKAALDVVDTALFAVCLEARSARGAEVGEVGYRELGEVMLHGDARNRWFDKSFQLIVCSNGKSAVNFEHAWGDGVAVLRYCNEVWKEATEHNFSPEIGDASACATEKLEWGASEEVKKAVTDAGKKFDAWLDSLNVSVAYVPEVSSKLVKKLGVGQDGLMQIAKQLAHYRLHGFLVSTYESANHAAFKHGRTETIRPATSEALEFCRVIDSDADPKEKAAKLRAAIARHGAVTKAALMGQGVDRLLFGLRKMAEIEGGDTPQLFDSPEHAKWSKIIISTSTLDSPALDGGGFGPVNDDCYAVGYAMRADDCGYIVSTYREDGAKLAELLSKSLRDMVKLLQDNPAPKEKK
eukprot:Hpha_TRINITY_DN16906_c1_g12::TRINITY_DN16906_c1_g12_i1::g.55267::m.55267/K08766/CPT2; carnitine O-palmitoyltransferase 2